MKIEQNFVMDRMVIEKDIQSFLGDQIRKKGNKVPVENNLSAADFKNEYVIKNKPVILKGIIDKWPAIQKWDLDYFANEYGNIEADINLYDAKNIKKSNLESLVKEIKQSTPANPVYLQEW